MLLSMPCGTCLTLHCPVHLRPHVTDTHRWVPPADPMERLEVVLAGCKDVDTIMVSHSLGTVCRLFVSPSWPTVACWVATAHQRGGSEGACPAVMMVVVMMAPVDPCCAACRPTCHKRSALQPRQARSEHMHWEVGWWELPWRIH